MVRVRIAPSPTGELHVGNVRAALFNWLFARSREGVFVLRLDDTDQARSEEKYVTEIVDGLRWLGLDWDEGIEVGGRYGTYRQSDRFDRYRQVAQQLLDQGHAYYDDRSPETLDELRRQAQSENKPPGAYIRRLDPPATSGVIRFAVTPSQPVEFTDVIREEMSFSPHTQDDFVILRSDGTPTYHLASVVDDTDYEITHVIRGEDLLPSTPKHILLTQALGKPVPVYAHLPLLFGPDGKKLSKRHGDVSWSVLRQSGILPQAMFNYLCLLGWSLDGDTTIFSVEQAIDQFRLEDVSKHPATFDMTKLEWMSGEYFRTQLSRSDFNDIARTVIESELGRFLSEIENNLLEVLSPSLVERTKRTTEIYPMVAFLFVDQVEYDQKSWQKSMKPETAEVLSEAHRVLSTLSEWSLAAIETELRRMLEEHGWKPRVGWQPVRIAVTGSAISPPLLETLLALGQQTSCQRIKQAEQKLLDQTAS